MKYSELYKKLRKAGCFPLRHGGRHDKWFNPANGKDAPVARHGTAEVPQGTLKSIYRQLGL
ncbi:type II toxin-antitoxin system HicA family toxin [Segatella sp.]|jgi:predicted RNA binding protein YcfA (HicA-like mRNA interferase family)|uniref:type II toxin-antitoxin system HicA family toxin n=1 Tax=Segatella sp. TaxID=2974253 RepID=UPI00205CBC17|nr:MAG TPA: HicA toxin [Caudoviricetes sp.]